MILLCCNPSLSNLSLSDFSDIAQVVIAGINLFLAAYIIIYQIQKDKKSDNDTARLNEQNIKLQWYKELIVQPNIGVINTFYDNLALIKEKITSNDLDEQQKESINEFVKTELSKIRKSFVDVLLQIDKPFADKVLENLDELVDGITNSIFDQELKLKLPAVYDKNIGSKISYSKNKLLALLYNYKGVS
jgi:hypothetical protein